MKGALKAALFYIGIGLAGVLVCAFPVTLKIEEKLGLDLLFLMRGSVKPPENVVVVAIRRNCARKLDLPIAVAKWPRRIHARLINQLFSAGADVIVFDLIFNELQAPEEDLEFSRAIANAQNIILAQALVNDQMPISDHSGRQIGHLNIERMIPPIPELSRPALAEAPFPLPKIPVSLRQYWAFKPSAGDIPTLPVIVFHAHARHVFPIFLQLLIRQRPSLEPLVPKAGKNGLSMDQIVDCIGPVRLSFQEDPGLTDLLRREVERMPETAQTRQLPDLLKAYIDLYQAGSSRYLNFYGPAGTIRTIPYHQVINTPAPKIPSLNLKGKVVFVGAEESAWPQAKDGFFTVYSQKANLEISGVEIAATALANLWERRSVRPLAHRGHLLVLLAWGLIVALASLRFSILFSTVVLLTLCGGYLMSAHLLFSSTGLWIPLAVPLLVQTPLAFFSVSIRKHLRLCRERQNIRDAFGYYLPDTVVDKLSQNISYLHNGGQVLYAVCLFTDAQKYTSISENMDPVSLTHFMNQYYQAIFQPIKENDGIVLQVIGDSVLAIWASPGPDFKLRSKACKAALEIIRAMSSSSGGTGLSDHRLPTRIGLHTGYIMLGNIGAMDHFEYRPVGDIVNTASRLEGLNKYLGTRILVSKDVLADMEGFVTRALGSFVFIGKTKAIAVHELIDFADHLEPKQIEACRYFAEGLAAFKSRSWGDAHQMFEKVSEQMAVEDGPSKFYLDLCDAYRQTPPSGDWNGTIALKQK